MVDDKRAVDYLPHDAPMVLVEEVLWVSEESACCQVTVGEGVLSPFLNAEGDLPAWFGIEIIAQTIGVWSGWHGRAQNNNKPSPGMLLGGRGYRCQAAVFPAGATLEVTVTLLMRDEKIGSFEGNITINGEHYASVRLNTYQPDREELNQLMQQGNNQ